MKKYDLHVSLQPEIHQDSMKHYWNITLTTKEGVFSIAHGYAKDVISAMYNANTELSKLNLN